MTNLKRFLFNAFCFLALGCTFTACSGDDNNTWDDSGSQVTLPARRAYILYEGSYGANNSGIAFYAPFSNADFIADIYSLQNGKQLGDTGIDLLEYDDHIYFAGSASKYVARMNAACVELTRHSFGETDGDPRYMVADDGFLYVTQYGGRVSKLNAQTLEVVDTFDGGDNLEGITECRGKLYVANSYQNTSAGVVYNNEILVINPQTMELENTLEVYLNPNVLMEVEDKVYLISWGDVMNGVPYQLQMIDPANNNQVINLGEFAKMAEGANDILYLVKTETNTADWSVTNLFFTYNTRTGQMDDSFLTNAPEELSTANIYLLEVDDETGDIYIGTTDYVTTGDIYRFDSTGALKEKFDAGGINPNSMVFIDQD